MVYQTKRLILQHDTNLAESIAQYYKRNQNFLRPFEVMMNQAVFETQFWVQALTAESKLIKKGSAVKLYLSPKTDRDLIIGSVALSEIIRGPFLSCFLGYRLDQNFINQGLMTEAVQEIIKIAFSQLNLHRIEANIMPSNKPSIRVVQKLGFQEEGLARKYLKINGVWQDHIHMVLLNDCI